MKTDLRSIAVALGLQFSAHDELSVSGVCADSRAVRPGDLFVCLPGNRSDGHNHAGEAIKAGAVAVLAERDLPECAAPVLVVENTQLALGKLAQWWRGQTRAKVVCVTGSCGKTTCKDALSAILGQSCRISATKGNYNNQIGLPLTILNANAGDDFWIIELGISQDGDMDYLGPITRPDLAIILNAGDSHLEGLGKKGVAWHKARLLNWLAPGGMALINGNYPALIRESAAYNENKIIFGSPDARFQCADSCGSGEYSFFIDGKRENFITPYAGKHVAETCLAAVAAASLLHSPIAAIRSGLKSASMPQSRFTPFTYGKFILIDDSYNANPLSMRASLAACAEMAKAQNKPFIAVLGEMGELGEEAHKLHGELGKDLLLYDPNIVFWKGNYAQEIAEGAAGVFDGKFFAINNKDEFLEIWKNLPLHDGAIILFKGSRLNRLEIFVETLKNYLSAREEHVL